MDDDSAEVQQRPVRVGPAFATDRPHALRAQLLGDAVADGAQLALRTARANDEVVRHGGQLGHVEQDDVGGLLVLGRIDDLAGDLERAEAHAALEQSLLDGRLGRGCRLRGGFVRLEGGHLQVGQGVLGRSGRGGAGERLPPPR